MAGSHGSTGHGSLLALVLGLALGVAVPAAAVQAGEQHWVTRDGRRLRLLKSESEFAVTFKTSAKVGASARRLASRGLGIVEDVPGAEDTRRKLLRAADVSSKRRNLVRQDPEIQEIRAVYRVEGTETPLFSTGTLLARVKSDLPQADRDELWSAYQLEVVEDVEGLADTYCLKPADDNGDEVLRAEALAADARTVWSQPNFRRRAIRKQIVPNDDLFPQQWHLENTGQFGGTPGADISALDAWLLSSGLDIRLGMFDDGCDVGHEDLFENYIGQGHDPTVAFNDEGADDPRPKQFGDRHGTAVMGLAVARANSRGVRGVAFQAQFTVSRGLAQLDSDLDRASVYTFARQQELDVHINSWGLPTDTPNPQILIDAIETAFLEGRDPDPNSEDDAPLGMVVVFAAGNGTDNDGVGIELLQGDDLSTLDTVIGVGASDNNDRIASLSNFGEDIDLLAPGVAGTLGLTTTDNDDALVAVDDGFNIAGFSRGVADVDPNGRYTNTFAGTSASCPIVAGVAALMLSANPLLTATNVRIVLEHTADRVSRDDAEYGNVTSRSLRYGHGRVNALEAVRSSKDALINGGFTWPDRVANLRIDDTTLRWDAPSGAREFLIVQSSGSFGFTNPEQNRFPEDGVGGCYSREQFGCGVGSVSTLSDLPAGVTLTSVVPCVNECEADTEFTVNNIAPGGSVAYAVYGRNGIGRYSWGVEATLAEDNGGGGTDGASTNVGPNVLIQARPLEGTSPLLVTFDAQAQRTNLDIDLDRIVWDFDIFDDSTVDSTTARATHEYTVPAGDTRTFTARLTMFDVDGNLGTAQVDIRVEGSSEGDSPIDASQSAVRILVGVPGNIDSDLSEGTSPLEVLLTIDATNLPGTLQSVVWDLGDGTTATSLVVPHTYTNSTSNPLRIPIIATVFTSTQTLAATRVLTVDPGAEVVEVATPRLEGAGVSGVGGSATVCGAVGMIPLMLGFAFLALMRRRHHECGCGGR